MNEELVAIWYEHFMFIENTDINKLLEIPSLMKRNSIDILSLHCHCEHNEYFNVEKYIFSFPKSNYYQYPVIPAIYNRNTIIKLLNQFKYITYSDLHRPHESGNINNLVNLNNYCRENLKICYVLDETFDISKYITPTCILRSCLLFAGGKWRGRDICTDYIKITQENVKNIYNNKLILYHISYDN